MEKRKMQFTKSGVDNGVDIEYELNKLIFKHNIDKRFPIYRKYVKAYDILKYYYQQLLLKEQLIVLISESETDLKWMQSCVCLKEEKKIVYNVIDISKNVLEKDVVYINLSYCHRDEIALFLAERDLETVSIYNLFEEQDLYFQNAFYDVYAEEYASFRGGELKRDFYHFDICHCFFRHRRMFELSKKPEERQRYLEKLIFDSVMAKDFLTIGKYIDFIETKEKARYVAFYQEVQKLFQIIKQELQGCKESVLLFWLDALEYDEACAMEYLQEMDSTAVSFSNAYTVTPYTGPTFKALITGKRTVDDEAFRLERIMEKDSVLLQELKRHDYGFKYYGVYNYLEKSKKANAFYTWYTPITQLYWDLIRELLLQTGNQKQVCLLHELLQTHVPFISLGLTGQEYNGRQEWAGQQVNSVDRETQAKESRKYVDEQLRFYGELLPKEMTKIYLSDHGHTRFGRFHTFLKIQNEKLGARQIKEMFSYKDFGKLLLDIIIRNQIDESYLLDDYVLIQDVDYYNEVYINDLVDRCDFSPELMFGYQGVITLTDMFIKHNNGTVFYVKHKNDEKMVTDERLEYLENLLSTKKIDVWTEEKFKATRQIYRAWEKSAYRYDKEEKSKFRIIRGVFQSIKEDEVLAIRGAGVEAIRLLMLLPYELRLKVKYVIDHNVNCVAGSMGIRVISPDEISDYVIDKILLCSFENKDIWKKELANYNIPLIDLYVEFEKEGIMCTSAFYKRQYIPEDFKL